jgi:hypothetical protein
MCNALRYNPEFIEEDVETAAKALLNFNLRLMEPPP